LALALLTGAACGALDLIETERTKLGFEPTAVLEALVTREEKDDQANARFFNDWMGRLRAIPGVSAVGLASITPLQRSSETIPVAIPGRPLAPPGEEPTSHMTVINGDYFAAAGIGVLEGNLFTPKDDMGAPAVALLSRRAAERFFPGESALGKTLIHVERRMEWKIIGIVDDVVAYDHGAIGMIYRPFAQEPRSEMFALVRGTDPAQLDAPVRDAVRALDRGQPVETRPLHVHIDEYLWSTRTTVRLIAIPALLSMLLAMLGVYGVAAYSVTQRRAELGIRAALGASPRALVHLVMREALFIAGVGGGVGLCLAFLLMTGLRRAAQMQGLSTQGVIGLGSGLLLLVLLASYGPAKRAARASPSIAMRS
jgi:putative ABC transport system permease protein